MTRVFKSKTAYVASLAFFALLATIVWSRHAHAGAETTSRFSNTELFLYLLVPFISVTSKFKRTQNALEKALIVLLALELLWMHVGRLRFYDMQLASPSLYWMTCFVLLTAATLGLSLRTLQVFCEPAGIETNTPAAANI